MLTSSDDELMERLGLLRQLFEVSSQAGDFAGALEAMQESLDLYRPLSVKNTKEEDKPDCELIY